MSKPILRVEKLNVVLGREKVLENLSFELKEKEILVVLGPNGAGKSVLLRTLLGLHPFGGEVSWRENVHLGYVPEDFDAPSDLPLSVKEFFDFKKVALPEISKTLQWMGIENIPQFLVKKLGILSTGQLRRTLISWALVDQPDVLLLDEPMAGIDIRGRQTIYDSLMKFWQKQNQTIILVSHELGEVVKKADKILALNKTRLFYGSPEEVINSQNLAKIYGGAIAF
jgi:zinc transport system ATP-binding protein